MLSIRLATAVLVLQIWASGSFAELSAAVAPAARDIRIVAVEQVGRPPWTPRDGRVYRLGGEAISDIRLGEMLIVRRPGEVRDIGTLRVVSVHTEHFAANSALAKLESKGETFPLKGDLVTKLASTDMPEIKRIGVEPLKEGFRPALDPLVMPGFPGVARGSVGPGPSVAVVAAPTASQGGQSSAKAPAARPVPASTPMPAAPNPQTTGPQTSSAASRPLVASVQQPAPRPAQTKASPAPTRVQTAAQPELGLPTIQPPSVPSSAPSGLPKDIPNFLEQNAIYFAKGSAEISPMGFVRLKEWTDGWGKKGLTYFLSVPQDQLRLQRLTVDRLAALQKELSRLGVSNVEMRYGENGGKGPFDTVYVGVEGRPR